MILTPPPPVTNCHTFLDPLPPPRARRTLWTAPKGGGIWADENQWRAICSPSPESARLARPGAKDRCKGNNQSRFKDLGALGTSPNLKRNLFSASISQS